YTLPLQANDTIILNHTKDKIEVSGKNAPSIAFYNQNLISKYFSTILSQFRQWAESGDINFSKIREAIQDMMQSDIDSLDRMCMENKVDAKTKNILKTSMYLSCNERSLNRYINTLGQKEDLSQSDSLLIQQEIDSIASVVPPTDKDIVKYNSFLYLTQYFKHCIYKRLAQENKRQLTDGYDYLTFGSLAHYLTAPDFIQLPLLGSAVGWQLSNEIIEFDAEKMFAYLAKKYPDSEYVALLGPMVEKAKKESNKKNTFYIEQEVGSIKELSAIDGIKGKYAYIDLWATWCGPCRMEFAHNEALYELLAKYDNITTVYISINDDSEATDWREYTDLVGLQGFNLRASYGPLYKELYKCVYEKGPFMIPRYLLLSPAGEIIDNNLPGPSKTQNLKIELDKYLKE
ncbi:MAG: TlpA family protein disulfide reductase, partial [Tannerellaceae bacterium]|nr:TlpA family protein disulfide reductase [Tannerellaceae bacterium]